MATYAVGDIQGCFNAFQQLLTNIKFDSATDTLWLTGDLVNRGPQSLEVLRFVKSLGDKHKMVLGNHDLHLLAVANGVAALKKGDTLDAILTAHDADELIEWLRFRPLLVSDTSLQAVMTHAGIPPIWSVAEAKKLAAEVEAVLRGESATAFFANMYGNEPSQWDADLAGMDRWRCIVNYFTRMRFWLADGSLDFAYKGDIANKPADLTPWFDVVPNARGDEKIIFGHWAALEGKTNMPQVIALDTGCVWGNCLTAINIETNERFSVKC